jgi:uncharacterized protein YecE (DUF72 family)
MPDIRVGTSGWNYPSGRGTWNGLFYPARRPPGFDELRYYAEHFDTVEVNSTFYRVPDPAQTRRWLERTPAEFLFSVKLYQKFTHPDLYLARNGVSDWNLSAGDFDEFRRGIAPVADAGRLAALLIQFPASFHARPETQGYLDWLLAGLDEYELAVELRHRTWSDAAEDTRARLAAHGATWVLIDEPKFKDSVKQGDGSRSVENSSAAHAVSFPQIETRPLYIRLHGRNARAWWDHDESEDRYDYLYAPEELAPFAGVARRAAASGRNVLMYLNNHFSAKSVANAAVLKHELGQRVPGDFPREIVARYPELSGIVQTSGLPL